MAKSQITQKELARLAGVSQQTVNRALAQHPDVSLKTQAEIARLAALHGYRPNSAAQAMRSGRFGCVLLLMSTDRGKSYLPVELLDGIHDGLAEHDQRLMVANLDDQTLSSDAILPAVLRRWMADGVIINYTHSIPPRLEELIRASRLPAVWVNVKRERDAVYPDDLGFGQAATRRLLDCGHRRIAFVNTLGELHYSSFDRRLGYEAAMRAAGLEPELAVIPDRYPPAAERRAWLAGYLRCGPLPSAMVFANVQDALAVRVLALELGMRVPRDLSLSTCAEKAEDRDGTALSGLLLPEHALGRAAVALLQRQAAEGPGLPAVAVPMIPFAGETIAPPAADPPSPR